VWEGFVENSQSELSTHDSQLSSYNVCQVGQTRVCLVSLWYCTRDCLVWVAGVNLSNEDTLAIAYHRRCEHTVVTSEYLKVYDAASNLLWAESVLTAEWTLAGLRVPRCTSDLRPVNYIQALFTAFRHTWSLSQFFVSWVLLTNLYVILVLNTPTLGTKLHWNENLNSITSLAAVSSRQPTENLYDESIRFDATIRLSDGVLFWALPSSLFQSMHTLSLRNAGARKIDQRGTFRVDAILLLIGPVSLLSGLQWWSHDERHATKEKNSPLVIV